MRSKAIVVILAGLILIFAAGCSTQRANTPSEKKTVEAALDQNGMKDIRVSEDRGKGVITLKGDVTNQLDKEHAEEIARAAANNSVIANEILVTGGDKSTAKEVNQDNDKAVEAHFKEWVAANHLKNQHVTGNVDNGVLTLTGDVDTPAQRSLFEKETAKIPGVTEVVNKLDIKRHRR